MPERSAELVLGDINGISIKTTPRYALKVSVSFDVAEAAHNAAAILLGNNFARQPAQVDLVPVMSALFDSTALRQAAEAALQAIIADEEEQAERDLEELERRNAIAQGPALTED